MKAAARADAGPRSTTARGLAAGCLLRVERGAYANLALPPLLERSPLEPRDRRFATELVYGTTRMRRACDWLVDAHLRGPVDPVVRVLLRMGAYQLAFAGTPPHAAVSETVDEAPYRVRGLINAVLRKVARALPPEWPDLGSELSYPDWVIDRLVADLGSVRAEAALRAMNEPATVTERPDGYVQDPASQAVAAYAASLVPDGGTVIDGCAGPGGKATALAGSGAGLVVAADVRPGRAALVAANARRVGATGIAVIVADGRAPATRPGSADMVLVDAPCTGLGVLGRRPDARWRIEASALASLVGLQRELLAAAIALLRAGGVLVYSVCTMTAAETVEQDDWLAGRFPAVCAVGGPEGGDWRDHGRGRLLLPEAGRHDGMYCIGLRTPSR